MVLSDSERRCLLERASTIEERLSQNFDLGIWQNDDVQLANRLSRWRLNVASGDSSDFEKYLARNGLSIDQARRALARPGWLGRESLPEWVTVVDHILAMSRTLDFDSLFHPDKTFNNNHVRFQEFYRPFVLVGRELLQSSQVPTENVVTKDVFPVFEDMLLQWLSILFEPNLEFEFKEFKKRTKGRDTEPSRDSNLIYWSFLDDILGKRLKAFLLEYCVSTRWGATFVLRWRDVIVELLQRLQCDLPIIAETFAPAHDPGILKEIELGLSDPHLDGRHVMRLVFESGLKLIYKPRSVSVDIAYDNLLIWLHEKGAPLEFIRVKVLDRDDYAWVEHVPHKPCRTPSELMRFCHNAGALLCLTYLLDAVDLHDANIIACGTHPVPVDLETFLQPRIGELLLPWLQTAQRRAMQHIEQSVFRTCLISNWKIDLTGEIADIGYLGVLFGSDSTAGYSRSEESNPIGAELFDSIKNEPQTTIYTRWTEALIDGFCSLYRFIEAHRREILSNNGPLIGFRGQTVRLVIRDTGDYMQVQQQSLVPEALRDGADRSIELQKLVSRNQLKSYKSGLFVPIIRSEIKALENFDIPLFTARTDRNAIEADLATVISQALDQPSYETVQRRIQQLSSDDLNRQTEFIKTAIAARLGINTHANSEVIQEEQDYPTASLLLDTDRLQREAEDICDELWKRAISGIDGSMTWIVPRPISGTDRLRVSIIPLDFYSGRAGIALFAAALHRATGQKNALELAQRLTNLLIRNLDLSFSSLGSPNHKNLGAMTGTGTSLYALSKLGEALTDPRPIEAAKKLVAGFKLDSFESSECLNIANGAAGSVLGLLAMREHGDALEKAVISGQHLMQAVSGKRCGKLTNRLTQLSAGFAYGASGIAYTFARLYRSCGQQEFSDVSLKILQFIDSCGHQELNSSWCHGHAGLTLARLKCEAYLEESNSISQIERGLERILGSSLGGLDTLCCGTIGRLDVLVTASEQLNRPELLSAAYGQAGRTIACSAGKGFRLLPEAPRGYFDPSLFKGISGVGYEFLRLACPAKTPSVLSWE